eukprot:1062389-Pleurochrysis_carterae.AAC.1
MGNRVPSKPSPLAPPPLPHNRRLAQRRLGPEVECVWSVSARACSLSALASILRARFESCRAWEARLARSHDLQRSQAISYDLRRSRIL